METGRTALTALFYDGTAAMKCREMTIYDVRERFWMSIRHKTALFYDENSALNNYNPAVGRFGQIDPFSANQQSGANLYTYCAADPVNSVDPTGMYEIDVHQFLTQYLAEKAGFNPAKAQEIGAVAQGPDGVVTPTGIDQSRSAYHDGHGDENNMEMYHFVSSSELRRMATWVSVVDDGHGTMKQLGEFFHAQEDTYAHSSLAGGRNFHYYGDWSGALVGDSGGGGLCGHFFHGHNPDQTWRDEAKAMKMARRVYEDLKRIHGDSQQHYPADQYADVVNEVTGPDPGWSAIEGDVRKFVTFHPHVVSTGGLVETVTFGGYNEKIHLLNAAYQVDDKYKQSATFKDGYPTDTGYVAGHYWSTKAKSAISSIGEIGSSMGDVGFGF